MNFFSYDSTFSRIIRKIWSCLLINTLWTICCLPVITAGAATSAMFYAVRKNIIHDESHPWSCFWRGFKREFKQATLIWLIFLAVGLLFIFDIYYFLQMLKNGDSEGTLFLLIAVMLVLAVLLFTYVYAYSCTFSDKISRVLKNSFLIMMSHPLVNLRVLILAVLIIAGAIYEPIFIMFLPAVSCWINWISFEKIFRRISPEAAAQYAVEEEEISEETENPGEPKKKFPLLRRKTIR